MLHFADDYLLYYYGMRCTDSRLQEPERCGLEEHLVCIQADAPTETHTAIQMKRSRIQALMDEHQMLRPRPTSFCSTEAGALIELCCAGNAIDWLCTAAMCSDKAAPTMALTHHICSVVAYVFFCFEAFPSKLWQVSKLWRPRRAVNEQVAVLSVPTVAKCSHRDAVMETRQDSRPLWWVYNTQYLAVSVGIWDGRRMPFDASIIA